MLQATRQPQRGLVQQRWQRASGPHTRLLPVQLPRQRCCTGGPQRPPRHDGGAMHHHRGRGRAAAAAARRGFKLTRPSWIGLLRPGSGSESMEGPSAYAVSAVVLRAGSNRLGMAKFVQQRRRRDLQAGAPTAERPANWVAAITERQRATGAPRQRSFGCRGLVGARGPYSGRSAFCVAETCQLNSRQAQGELRARGEAERCGWSIRRSGVTRVAPRQGAYACTGRRSRPAAKLDACWGARRHTDRGCLRRGGCLTSRGKQSPNTQEFISRCAPQLYALASTRYAKAAHTVCACIASCSMQPWLQAPAKRVHQLSRCATHRCAAA